MGEAVTNELLCGFLKRMQERLGRREGGLTDVMTELRSHKTMLGALVSQQAVQDGRIAEISLRLDRIKTRTDLREAN